MCVGKAGRMIMSVCFLNARDYFTYKLWQALITDCMAAFLSLS